MYYRKLSEDLEKIFSEKLYKISLEGGFTCPNRDGKLDTRGCIFCLNGSGDFAESVIDDLDERIEKAKSRVRSKSRSDRFIAYFQSYTNTYAPVEYLESLYTKVINRDDIAGLSIATRPDCISDETIELIDRLNKIKPVWIELGLQTTKIESIRYIRRGYDTIVFDDVMKKLKAKNIYTVVHMIIGLPGETMKDILATADHIAKTQADAVKLQLLHVLKGTDLCDDYLAGKFTLPSLDEYIDILEAVISILPRTMTIHRLTGDGDKKYLVAPMWSQDKKRVLNTINSRFKEDDLEQGSRIQ